MNREERAAQGRAHIITGAIGEHLVAAELLSKGHRILLAGAGYPYDLVADIDNKLYKIQVKSTGQIAPHGRGWCGKNVYCFGMQYKNIGSEIVAFVALDIKVIAYLPSIECDKSRINFKAPGFTSKNGNKDHPTESIDFYTLDRAIRKLQHYEKTQKKQDEHQARSRHQRDALEG